jgi:hypothetical protein
LGPTERKLKILQGFHTLKGPLRLGSSKEGRSPYIETEEISEDKGVRGDRELLSPSLSSHCAHLNDPSALALGIPFKSDASFGTALLTVGAVDGCTTARPPSFASSFGISDNDNYGHKSFFLRKHQSS